MSCCAAVYLSAGTAMARWFHGFSMSAWHGNAELRTAQYQASFDPQRSLDLAKSIVYAKIMNCRTLLMRNHRGEERPKALLRALT